MSNLKLKGISFVADRVGYILERCMDKSVLHLGFADAIHYQESIKDERHLHEALLRNKRPDKALVGVDIRADRVTAFRELWPEANLVVGDVEHLDDSSLRGQFDVVVAGELIEHLYNPGLFLSGVKNFMAPGATLILTTPNAINLKAFLHAIFGQDRSHPDHTMLFSYSTINTLLERHGFKVSERNSTIEVFDHPRNKLSGPWLKRFYKLTPALADTMIIEARIQVQLALET